jgi:fatty-acyl-CoA synthase
VTIDQDGRVNIVGRSKDLIIRGGENVCPREIEDFLFSYPEIEDVNIVGIVGSLDQRACTAPARCQP